MNIKYLINNEFHIKVTYTLKIQFIVVSEI